MHVGIDPGKSGSVCFLDVDTETFKIIPTPIIKLDKREYDIPEMRAIVEKMVEDCKICVIEKSQAMPGQGVSSMFSIGKGYGIWLGLLVAHGIPFIEVHPKTWTKKMFFGQGGEGKERNYMKARQLFPNWQPKHKYEREYADSLLLASYGARYL